MLKMFFYGLTLLLFSCNSADQSPSSTSAKKTESKNESFPVKALVIDNGEISGWGADIRLSIISAVETDTSKIYAALSTYQGKKLGLAVSIPKAKEGDKGFANGMVLKSIGPESDYLLLTLSQLYKQPFDTNAKFTNAISLTYVDLNEFAKNLGSQNNSQYETKNQYKLFYEGNNEDEYAELYLNINPTEYWIELKEKDKEYRSGIIKFLRQQKSYNAKS